MTRGSGWPMTKPTNPPNEMAEPKGQAGNPAGDDRNRTDRPVSEDQQDATRGGITVAPTPDTDTEVSQDAREADGADDTKGGITVAPTPDEVKEERQDISRGEGSAH